MRMHFQVELTDAGSADAVAVRDESDERVMIDVILGNGVIPNGAENVANRGRPSRKVAAEFLSRKLWQEFADTDEPPVAAPTSGKSSTQAPNRAAASATRL